MTVEEYLELPERATIFFVGGNTGIVSTAKNRDMSLTTCPVTKKQGIFLQVWFAKPESADLDHIPIEEIYVTWGDAVREMELMRAKVIASSNTKSDYIRYIENFEYCTSAREKLHAHNIRESILSSRARHSDASE